MRTDFARTKEKEKIPKDYADHNVLLLSLVFGDFLRGQLHGSALMEVKLYVFVTFLSCSHSNSNDGCKNLDN